MILSERGAELIKTFEGLELVPYRDVVGILTVGHGHVTQDPSVITLEQAQALFDADAEVAAKCVRGCGVPLTQGQFDALVSFVFNLGCKSLRDSTLLKRLREEDYQGAADEILRWNKAGGKEVSGLTRRRKAERDLFLSTGDAK